MYFSFWFSISISPYQSVCLSLSLCLSRPLSLSLSRTVMLAISKIPPPALDIKVVDLMKADRVNPVPLQSFHLTNRIKPGIRDLQSVD